MGSCGIQLACIKYHSAPNKNKKLFPVLQTIKKKIKHLPVKQTCQVAPLKEVLTKPMCKVEFNACWLPKG